jgi:hypothetical protein
MSELSVSKSAESNTKQEDKVVEHRRTKAWCMVILQ